MSPDDLDRLSSAERHRRFVADAVDAMGIPVVGAVPRDAACSAPERHLGLVQAKEHGDLASRLDRLAGMAEHRPSILTAFAAMAAPLAP